MKFARLREKCVTAINNSTSEQGYVMAGTRYFRDLWTRDFCYASRGIQTFNNELSEHCFGLLLKHQAETGKMPILLGQYPDNYLGSLMCLPFWDVRMKNKYPLTPRYGTLSGFEDLDSTMLFIIYYSKYCKDYGKLLKAVKWVEKQDRNGNGLIDEEPFAGWEDTINKTRRRIVIPPRKLRLNEYGNSSYHNLLAVKCYRAVSGLAGREGDKKTSEYYNKLWRDKLRLVNEKFWNPEGYFNDFLGDDGNNMNASANLLAIYLGLADRKQAKQILKNIESFGMDKSFGLKVRDKKLPAWRINFFNRLLGTSDYHNTAQWLWLSALHVICLNREGMKDKAASELAKIEGLVVGEGVKEVYNKGRALNGLIHKSEVNFTWAAGMILEALQEFSY